MIKVNNVVKTFEGFRALDGLTMTAEKGSIYGLVGPNGAGKSTILRHIIGVYRPDSGSVLVDGQPVYENPAVKAKIATIPDELYYFASASTRDMMRFYRGMYPQFDAKRYEALKDAFPEVDEKQPIRRLSKGMQKQSAFWLALCCQPEVLVLDEPVDGLDPVMRRQGWCPPTTCGSWRTCATMWASCPMARYFWNGPSPTFRITWSSSRWPSRTGSCPNCPRI